jgi:hypothetical protein
MKLRAPLWFASAALVVHAASAQYNTGFEFPPFNTGDIAGQDSWTTSTNTGTARVLTADQIMQELVNGGIANPGMPVHSGSQALVVSGAGASNATIRVITGLETKNNVLLDVWTRPLPGSTQGNIFLTMEDAAGDRAAAFRFGTAFGNTIDYGTNVGGIWQSSNTMWNCDTWYHLTMSVDYLAKSYDFFVDGTKINASPIPFYNAASDNFVQLRIFRGTGQAGMIVDDLAVSAVPEPGGLGSLLAGGTAILLHRRRR